MRFALRPISLWVLTGLWFASAAWADVSVDVHLDGLDGTLKDNVEASLSIRRTADGLTGGTVKRLHARAREEILLALQPFGYYAPTVRDSLVQDDEKFDAYYHVDPGEPVLIEAVDVQVIGPGAADTAFVGLADSFPLSPGDVLDHVRYQTGKIALQLYAARQGYLDAAFDSSAILVDLVAYEAAIVLHFDTGIRYKFGDVRLHQDALDDDMVQGYNTIRPGEPYEANRLLKLQADLTGGPYFSTVEVQTVREEADGDRVPVDVNMIPARTRRYEVGAGYGTDTGFRGSFGVEFRRLNRRGHHAEGNIELSQREITLSSRYMIPWPYPRTEELSFFAGIGRFDPGWSESRRVTGGVSLSKIRWGWQEVISLAYEFDDWTISELEDQTGLLLLGASWTRVRTDNRFDPENGRKFELKVQGAHDAVLSSVSLLRGTASVNVARGLPGPLRSFWRASIGGLTTSSFVELPPGQRFVTGGDQTVRGYGYESLGPLQGGDLAGGDLLALVSGELEWRFHPKLGIAGFVDSGNAYAGSFGRFAVGPGVGIRWISPIGLLRLDGAWGISRGGDPFHIHFVIGPVF